MVYVSVFFAVNLHSQVWNVSFPKCFMAEETCFVYLVFLIFFFFNLTFMDESYIIEILF